MAVELSSLLTDEQIAIAEEPADSAMLVTAGAGTGKTHVLIARLRHLIDTCGLSPGQEILVLSFTRAAVREVKRRVVQAGGDVAYVRAFTFDSFATRMLAAVDEDGPWAEETFDGRIAAAEAAIIAKEEAKEYVGRYRHVLVDEVQDLVGVRADFVKALLGCIDGFTLFGDPAQGIYNYQLEGDDRREGSQALYAWLRKHYNGSLTERALKRNFRASSDVARAAVFAGPLLNEPEPDYEGIREQLDAVVASLPSVGGVDQIVNVLEEDDDVNTAILTRTNGEALMLSRQLHQRGVVHRLQRSATDRALAPWIALALTGYDKISIGKSAFLSRVARTIELGHDAPEPEEAWRLMKRIDRTRGNDLNLGTVGQRVMRGDVPDELSSMPSARIVVSTIHRAKGLEFERVLICEPDGDPFWDDSVDEDLQLAEETRVLYVALTRTKRDMAVIGKPDIRGMRRLEGVDQRWVRRGYGKWKGATFDLELRGDDVHRLDPAGSYMVDRQDAWETQKYIAKNVQLGDRLELFKHTTAVNGTPRVYYLISHKSKVVGVTADRFASVLYGALKRPEYRKVWWPDVITDVYVDGIDTVAGTQAAARAAGMGVVPLWLRVRTFGLGNLVRLSRGK